MRVCSLSYFYVSPHVLKDQCDAGVHDLANQVYIVINPLLFVIPMLSLLFVATTLSSLVMVTGHPWLWAISSYDNCGHSLVTVTIAIPGFGHQPSLVIAIPSYGP